MSIRRDDAFERIVDEAVSVEERTEMSASAQRFALIFWIRKSVLAEHRRLYLYADEHPEAAQDLVDPSIRLSERARSERSWNLPAGWVRIVNDLHADLSCLLGDYEVAYVGQYAGGLRFRTSPITRGEAARRIGAARAESMAVCAVCGGTARLETPPRSATRCPRHPHSSPDKIVGAMARPPGCTRKEWPIHD